MTPSVEREPGESRERWAKRAMAQDVGDVTVGELRQSVYDQLEEKGSRATRVGRALDRKLPELEQPDDEQRKGAE